MKKRRQSSPSRSPKSPRTPPSRRRLSSFSPRNGSPSSILFNIKSSSKPSSSRFNKKSSLSGLNLDAANLNFSRSRSPLSASKTLTSVSDLKSVASSRFHDLKRLVDRSHSETVKEIEGGNSRLHKQFKMQVKSSQQNLDEVDEECNEIAEQISEIQKAMEATYVELMEDAQATAFCLCKTAIPDLSQSFEEAIDALRSRFGIPSA